MEQDNEQSHPESPERATEAARERVLKPGESWGNFRVVKCLCAGLIANYYHMQHIRDLHDVAAGIFHKRSRKDPKFPKRLEGLQKKVQGLDHEGIPKIREYSEVNGRDCLFLDPVKGQTLSQYFAAHGIPGQEGLKLETTTRLQAQMLGLLGYVHAQGLDHRDIDSDMIFIQEDGSLRLLGLGVKAALGVALFEEIVSASVSPLQSNKTAGRVNSFDIMSPEYKGGIEEDSRVDVYGTGVLGYWMLTGQKPSLAHFQKPSELVDGLPARWDAFLRKSLERDREQRFQSCRAALLALKETDNEPESDGKDFIQRQIDRIPVPKGVQERGELATRIYRLSVIGVVGVSLVALTANFVRSVFTDDAAESPLVAVRTPEGATPQLRVEVDPPAARLELPDAEQSFLFDDGRLDLDLASGRHRLLVSAPGFASQEKSLRIPEEGGPTVRVSFTLEPDLLELTVNSRPGATISVIESSRLEIELGQADADGRFALSHSTGEGPFSIVAKKPGHQSATASSEGLPAGATTLDLPLTPLPSTLEVRTEPTGARISIDGEPVGLSPLDHEIEVPGEAVLVVAELEGYRSIGRRLEPPPGRAVAVDFGQLVPRSADLNVTVDFPGLSEAAAAELRPDVRIVVGDERYPLDAPELDFVPEGPQVVRAEHPLYISEERELVLKDRATVPLQFSLQPRPGRVELVLPPGLPVEVRVDGRTASLADDHLEVPARQPLELELRIPDHLTMRREVLLQPAETIRWEVAPVRIPPPEAGQDWTLPYLGMDFVWVPPGNFTMGSLRLEQGRLPNEGPPTEVRLSSGFWAGSKEVTQAEYAEIMGLRPSGFEGAQLPVESVSQTQARAFCQRLTEAEQAAGRLPTGYVYRLPTEAEWEYAARAGTAEPFHFGSAADASRGNFRGLYPRDLEEGVRVPESYGTEPVGQYAANAFKLYDVHGNVREWTAEVYRARLPGGSWVDPTPPTEGERYAVRGGSWEDFAVRVRSAAREEVSRGTRSNSLGFRVFLAPALKGADE